MDHNRKETVKINGEVHQIIYPHDSNKLVLKGATTTFELQEVEGQYVLETQQRRDLVATELLHHEQYGAELTGEDLLRYGFREVV